MAQIINKTMDRVEDAFRALLGKPQLWRTKYGNIELVGKNNRRQVESIIAKLQRTTEALTKSDIQRWRKAWQRAISIENPNREMLYDIYRDTMIDAHLSGCIDQRKGFVRSKAFNVEDQNGTPNPQLKHLFEQEWFGQFCDIVLLTPYYGHSLIELGDLTTDGDGCIAYDSINLVDRKYVIPEHHAVITDLGMDWTTGIDYHLPELDANLIEVGKPDDLGVLLKAALHAIPKKNVLAAWDIFCEIFGMPLRTATTSSRDQKEIDRISDMMERMGMAGYAVLPTGTEIDIVESAKSDAYNVYDKRIDRANSEISKLIVGQTMTIEDGSSLSQSQTHLKVLENLVKSDAALLANTINNQLFPKMIRHGFPLKGYHFAWDESVNYTPEQQMQYETMITDRYEVDPKYFADKYNMPVGNRREQHNQMLINPDQPFFD